MPDAGRSHEVSGAARGSDGCLGGGMQGPSADGACAGPRNPAAGKIADDGAAPAGKLVATKPGDGRLHESSGAAGGNDGHPGGGAQGPDAVGACAGTEGPAAEKGADGAGGDETAPMTDDGSGTRLARFGCAGITTLAGPPQAV
jgi:hypothetical protein